MMEAEPTGVKVEVNYQDYVPSAGEKEASRTEFGKDIQKESQGIVAGLLRAASCRRRATAREAKDYTPQGYRDLVILGRKLAAKDRDSYARMAWWSEAETRDARARVFVIAPPDEEDNDDCHVDMWKLLAYAVSEMHDHVVEKDKPYAVVWMQLNDHKMWSFSALLFKRTLHGKYSANLDAVHVVHPSWAIRWLRLVLWPIASEEFWDRFYSHERIEFLDEYLPLSKLSLPSDFYEYDKFLDEYGHRMSEEAALHLGSNTSQ